MTLVSASQNVATEQQIFLYICQMVAVFVILSFSNKFIMKLSFMTHSHTQLHLKMITTL